MAKPTIRIDGDLRIYGNLSLLEMAPVLLAARRFYAGKTVIEHGGVMSLWGKPYDLPSLDAVGNSDVAANSETQVLRSSFANPDLRIIFTLAMCPYRIIGRRSAGIAQLADLCGKRIGVMPKSSGAYFLDRMLRTIGLTEQDVTSVPFMAKSQAPLSLMPQALRDGGIDAVAVWEPESQKAKLAIAADAIEFCDPAVYHELFNLCTTQSHLDDPAMRQKMIAFVRALITATVHLQQDPHDARLLVAQAAGLGIASVENSWPYLTYPGTLAADLLDVLFNADAWVAKETSRAPRTCNELSQLVDSSVLRDALAA